MLLVLGILILFLPAFIIFYGMYHFSASVEKEKEALFNNVGKREQTIIQQDLETLPPQLKSYLTKVGVIGKCKDCHVIFKQNGQIKTGQDKKWTSFTATQYMTPGVPGFIWSARSFPLFIRDKSSNGKGEVRINLFGLKDVAKFEGYKTDQSALSRCLGELLFYPIGFLSDVISWEELGNGSLKAKVDIDGTKAEGIFYFNEEGLLFRFESRRYMDDTLERFTGIAEDYKTIDGLYIPTKMRAIWNLEEGDFEYFNCTITKYWID